MAHYTANWDYRAAWWPEPVTAGQLLDLTEDQADAFERDSPGILEPVEIEVKPKRAAKTRKTKAPAEAVKDRGN